MSVACQALDYMTFGWFKPGDVKELEKIQKRATKLVINLQKNYLIKVFILQTFNTFKVT